MGAVQLEQLLVEEGLADPAKIERARTRAAAIEVPVVRVLVEEEGVPEDVLADALARAVGTVVIDIEHGVLDRDSVRLIPGALARKHLLLPVSPADEILRVAFADPLDRDAVAAVQEIAGCGIEPLVATVSGVMSAIARFHEGDTRVIRALRREFPAEITRRVDEPPIRPSSPPEGRAPGTAPLHRMESEATIEQRHEALLLALIEKGVITRADYIAALRRLLGRG